MKDIAIFGAGGLGREIACLINLINKETPTWNIIGFYDDNPLLKGTKNEYGEVLGGIDELNQYRMPLDLVIAIGSPNAIQKVVGNIKNSNISFPNIIAPSTIFLDVNSVKMGKGNIICSRCSLSCNIIIGDYNLFNGNIPLGHDCEIGSFNVVMPSVNISGGVKMGNSNFLGVQSVVLQYLKIGNHVRLGANSVMMRNAKDGYLYMGNPAKKMEL